MPLMSMREYARHAGVSLKAIQDRIHNGSITKAAIVDDGGRFPKIDSAIADADFQQRHNPEAKAHGALGGATKTARAKPTSDTKPQEVTQDVTQPIVSLADDDNPEGLPDIDPKLATKLPETCHEIATKLPETPQVVDKSGEKPPAIRAENVQKSGEIRAEKGILPDTKPPEIPKPRVEEREINGQKVDATVLPTLPEDKFDRYRDAKTSTEELRARKLELEVAEAEGRLLDADDVRKEIVKLVGETREAFLNLGPKLAPILVSITDPVEMENKLIESINDTLHNLSRFENGVG